MGCNHGRVDSHAIILQLGTWRAEYARLVAGLSRHATRWHHAGENVHQCVPLHLRYASTDSRTLPPHHIIMSLDLTVCPCHAVCLCLARSWSCTATTSRAIADPTSTVTAASHTATTCTAASDPTTADATATGSTTARATTTGSTTACATPTSQSTAVVATASTSAAYTTAAYTTAADTTAAGSTSAHAAPAALSASASALSLHWRIARLQLLRGGSLAQQPWRRRSRLGSPHSALCQRRRHDAHWHRNVAL